MQHCDHPSAQAMGLLVYNASKSENNQLIELVFISFMELQLEFVYIPELV